MIISRTPVRVSFCGGGTDLDWFANSEQTGGRVTSVALNRHIYVTVNARFDEKVRISYSKMELVDNFEELEHELIRESMRITGVTSGVEITTIADIPSRGTGLGSSSTVTIGVLNALHNFAGRKVSANQLAEEACRIEIDILGQPIGRQDQYAAAYGGVNSISFGSDGVVVKPLDLGDEVLERLESEFTLIFTGMSRRASSVLSESPEDEADRLARLRAIRAQADLAQAQRLGLSTSPYQITTGLSILSIQVWVFESKLTSTLGMEMIILIRVKLIYSRHIWRIAYGLIPKARDAACLTTKPSNQPISQSSPTHQVPVL